VLLALSFYPTYTILPNWSYWDSTVLIKRFSDEQVQLGFIPKNSIIVGKIYVDSETYYGTSMSQITMWLIDSLGNIVINSVLVDGVYSFVYQTAKDDFYYFVFDNTAETLDIPFYYFDKSVLWQIYYYGNYTLVFQISGVLSLAIGLICILMKRRYSQRCED